MQEPWYIYRRDFAKRSFNVTKWKRGIARKGIKEANKALMQKRNKKRPAGKKEKRRRGEEQEKRIKKRKSKHVLEREGRKEEEWERVGGRGNPVRRKMSLVISFCLNCPTSQTLPLKRLFYTSSVNFTFCEFK